MNVKVHTPKTLKTGSGMGTVKQFLLSLVATTISIVLTFGTAGWLESRKKEADKREMVMMILYDLAGSIEQVIDADSLLREGFEQQLAVAENPDLLKQNRFLMTKYIPTVSYTETVEQIFSSNIETINILGNVLFAENVSDIYRLRRLYKEIICDKFVQELDEAGGFVEYEQVISIDYPSEFIYLSSMLLNGMKEKFAQCQQMMDVSDADLQAYRQKRQKMTQTSAADSIKNALLEEAVQNNQRQNAATEKGKAKLVE